MASTYLQRTQGTATNRNIFTASMWVKLSKLGSDLSDYQFMDFYVSGSIRISLYHNDDDTLRCHMSGGGYDNNVFTTSAKLRDTSAWYHLVWRFDTTQSTASDRVRVYINGELATFSSTNYPSQNFNLQQGTSSYTHYIGKYGGGTSNNFDGVMSHVHFCDGYSYAPSEFGETDATTGEWKIKTSPSVTYGNNGFFILKDGNSVTDQSGQGNNLTVGGGTLTKTEDCPSNVFCTINSLDNYYQSGTITNGNTKIQTGSLETYTLSTLGASSGKYYCEMKLVSSTSAYRTRFGIAYEPTNSTSDWLGKRAVGWSYREDGLVTNNNSNYSGTWNSYTSGDIIGMAMDLDNNKLYFAKNGTWQNSGDPTSGSTGTGGVTLTADKTYLIGIGDETGGYSVCEFNFGNGYFGTTAVSSAGTNASGNGIFEYDVPTGYTALSTKGLNL